jgi:hypothetical protein
MGHNRWLREENWPIVHVKLTNDVTVTISDDETLDEFVAACEAENLDPNEILVQCTDETENMPSLWRPEDGDGVEQLRWLYEFAASNQTLPHSVALKYATDYAFWGKDLCRFSPEEIDAAAVSCSAGNAENGGLFAQELFPDLELPSAISENVDWDGVFESLEHDYNVLEGEDCSEDGFGEPIEGIYVFTA